MKTVVIDGVEYIRKESLEKTQKMIVICDNRGLTMIGDVNLNSESEWVLIANAQCIIRWGTIKHLAELVNGPTDKTVLGEKQDFWVQKSQIIGVYKCLNGWDENE